MDRNDLVDSVAKNLCDSAVARLRWEDDWIEEQFEKFLIASTQTSDEISPFQDKFRLVFEITVMHRLIQQLQVKLRDWPSTR